MGRPVTHFQILAREPDKLSQFYARLLGWKVNADNALGYREVNTESERGIQGGFWPAPPEGRPLVQLFVEVEDVGRDATRAKELGGTVVIPPQVLPGGDELAIVLDPEGLPFGLMKPAGARNA